MRRRTVQFCAVVFGLLVVYTGLAHAAPGSTGSGSCGPAPEQYGLTGIAANMFGPGSRTVPALHYKVDYVVDNPTTLALLVRQNDEIGATEFILSSWPSSGTQGSYEGAWLADIRPEAQGAGFSVGPAVGRYDGPANSQWLMRSQSNTKPGRSRRKFRSCLEPVSRLTPLDSRRLIAGAPENAASSGGIGITVVC